MAPSDGMRPLLGENIFWEVGEVLTLALKREKKLVFHFQ